MVSEKALRWPNGDELDQPARDAIAFFAKELSPLLNATRKPTRRELFDLAQKFQGRIHELLASKVDASLLGNFEKVTGLNLADADSPDEEGRPRYEVHAVRPLRRRGPSGEEINQVVLCITQSRSLTVDGEKVRLHGGCTLILDLDTLELRYAIGKSIQDAEREAAYLGWLGENPTAAALAGLDEPIAYLHVTG